VHKFPNRERTPRCSRAAFGYGLLWRIVQLEIEHGDFDSVGAMQVLAAWRSQNLSTIVHQRAAQECRHNLCGELQSLERRVALLGFGLRGADDE
jgi:hypothetical protein